MIESGNPFPFSGSHWDKWIKVQVIPDKSVNIFRIVSFVENVGVRFSGSVTLNKDFLGVGNIVDRLLRDLEPGNDLKIHID